MFQHMTALLKGGNEPGVIFCPLLKKSYQVPPKIINGGGFWWEAVVADAFKRHLEAEVYGQLAWKTPEGKDGKTSDRLTEIDVAAAYGNHKLMVSCKAGRSFSLHLDVFAIKSEAVHRFGRFTLPFLAVPYESGQKEGRQSGLQPGIIIGGAMILTPSILVDREKLIAHINLLAEHLRTTSSKKDTA